MSGHPELTLTDSDGDRLELRREGGEVILTVIENDVASMVALTPIQRQVLAAALKAEM